MERLTPLSSVAGYGRYNNILEGEISSLVSYKQKTGIVNYGRSFSSFSCIYSIELRGVFFFSLFSLSFLFRETIFKHF